MGSEIPSPIRTGYAVRKLILMAMLLATAETFAVVTGEAVARYAF